MDGDREKGIRTGKQQETDGDREKGIRTGKLSYASKYN